MKKDSPDAMMSSAHADDKHRVMVALLLFLLIASLFVFVMAASTIKSYGFIGTDPAQKNTITVSGKGEAIAVPDVATFTVSVMEEALQVKDAQQATARKMDAAIAFLTENGVEKKDIKTTNYSVYPDDEFRQPVCRAGLCPPGGERVLKGYQVSQTILVKVRTIDTTGKLLGGMGTIGVSDISGLTLAVDDSDALVRLARRQAIQKAQAQARLLADDLGVRLVRMVNFSEGGSPYPLPQMKQVQMGVMSSDAAAPTIPVGENTITSQVSIVYEIR